LVISFQSWQSDFCVIGLEKYASSKFPVLGSSTLNKICCAVDGEMTESVTVAAGKAVQIDLSKNAAFLRREGKGNRLDGLEPQGRQV